MSVSKEFLSFLEEQLTEFGAVNSRRMFGGAGLYHQGIMFALIASDTLYFKADDSTCGDYEAVGMGPFVYNGKGKPVSMSYWEVPERLYDAPDELADWARARPSMWPTAIRIPPSANGNVAEYQSSGDRLDLCLCFAH